MSCSIFIKTYPKDFEWLQYCLKSIAKFATGFEEVVIVCDSDGKKELDGWGLTREKVYYNPPIGYGYIDQQIVKLTCDKWVKSEYVLFMDSDAIFNRPVTPETFMRGGKPFILKTNYEELKGSDGFTWKAITEKAMGFEVEFEYMRRLGLMYRIETLKNMREFLPYDYRDYAVLNVKNREFSEFNMMGAYAEKFESDKYIFHDTKDGFDESPINQYWSYGKLTDEIRNEINELLK